MSAERQQAQVNGSYLVTDNMRAVLRKANGGRAFGNGIEMYPQFRDHFIPSAAHLDGLAAEHVAAFESRDPNTGKLNATRVAEELDLIQQVTAQNRTVLMNLWPGPVVSPKLWPNNSQPSTNAGRAQALLDNLPLALALYLTVAEPTVFFQYVWWYPVTDGVLACPDAPDTCMGPPGWYPDVTRPLGPPDAPATRKGNVYTRKFAHADVLLDLDHPERSGVEWR